MFYLASIVTGGSAIWPQLFWCCGALLFLVSASLTPSLPLAQPLIRLLHRASGVLIVVSLLLVLPARFSGSGYVFTADFSGIEPAPILILVISRFAAADGLAAADQPIWTPLIEKLGGWLIRALFMFDALVILIQFAIYYANTVGGK